MPDHPRQIRSIVDAVRRASDAGACVRRCARSLEGVPKRAAVIAVGKAAAAMYAGWREAVDEPARQFIVVPDGAAGPEVGLHALPAKAMRAEHPLPGEKSLAAARSLAEFVAQCKASADVDGFVVLLSGGASSLLAWPIDGLEIAGLRALTQRLMRSGADIRQLNTVRKHLERLKGGRLAELMAPKPVHVLALSDVVGDDAGTIASGPFSPDPTTYAEAMRIVEAALGIERREVEARPAMPEVVVAKTPAEIGSEVALAATGSTPKRPRTKATKLVGSPSAPMLESKPSAAVAAPPRAERQAIDDAAGLDSVEAAIRPAVVLLRRGARGELPETPKPGSPALKHVRYTFVGSNVLALESAKAQVESLGFSVAVVKAGVTGAASDAGKALAQAAVKLRGQNKASAILIGGETTVRVVSGGSAADPGARGGRNQELALAAAIELDGIDSVVIASFATDGIDGPTDAAGAIVTGRTCLRARSLGVDAKQALTRHDSYGFFERLEKAGQPHWIRTGATGTNVNDLALALVYPKGW